MGHSESSRKSGPSSLAPEALAALGKLRECVSAARNLEHLIGARDVGPKALVGMVPDVISELEPFGDAVVEISAFICADLRLPSETLDGLVESAHAEAASLLNALRDASGEAMNARRRLSMERRLRASLPPLSSALSQVELLVEATSQSGVAMSVYELLTSTPEAGSNRPQRQVTYSGNVGELFISVPPRVGMRCLGMVASALDPELLSTLHLDVEGNDNFVVMKFEIGAHKGAKTVKLPVYPHTIHSLTAVEAVVNHFGGTLAEDGRSLSLQSVLP